MSPRSHGERLLHRLPWLRTAVAMLLGAWHATGLIEMPESLAGASNRVRQRALREAQLIGYDDGMAPDNASVEVSINFESIQGINLKTSTMTVVMWYRLIWKDESLAWNDTQWRIGQAFRSSDEIWTPDVVFYNGLDSKSSMADMRAQVSPDGSVFWSRPSKSIVLCKFVGLENFPKDELSCSIELGSWFLDGLQQSINPWETDGGLDWIGKQGDAVPLAFQDYSFKNITVERLEVYYSCCPGRPYYLLNYGIVFTRATNFYVSRLVLPQIFAAVISWLTFWMHPQVGERLGFGIALILTSVAFDWIAADHIPICDEPLMLNILTQSTSCMIIFSLLESTVVLYIYFWRAWTAEHFVPLPLWLAWSYLRRRFRGSSETELTKKLKLLGSVPETEKCIGWSSQDPFVDEPFDESSSCDGRTTKDAANGDVKAVSNPSEAALDGTGVRWCVGDSPVKFLERAARIRLYRRAFFLLDSNYTSKLEHNEVHHFGEYMMGQDWTSRQTRRFMGGKKTLSLSDFCERCDTFLLLGNEKDEPKLQALVEAFSQNMLRADASRQAVSQEIAHRIDKYCRWLVPPIEVIIMATILTTDFTPAPA